MLSRLVRSVASALVLVEPLATLRPVSYHPTLLDNPNLAAAILATTRGPGSHTSAYFTHYRTEGPITGQDPAPKAIVRDIRRKGRSTREQGAAHGHRFGQPSCRTSPLGL